MTQHSVIALRSFDGNAVDIGFLPGQHAGPSGQAAYDRGYGDGMTAARIDRETAEAAATARLAQSVEDLLRSQADFRQETAASTGFLIDTLLDAIAPGIALSALREGIAAAIRHAADAATPARPSIRLAPAAVATMQVWLAERDIEAEVTAADCVGPLQVEIDWGSGLTRLDTLACVRRCQAIVARYLPFDNEESRHEPVRFDRPAPIARAAE